MKKITELVLKYKDLILYGIFGVFTTVVNLLVFWLCGKVLGEDMYLVSNGIAWFAAVVFAYFTNKLFVFESKSFALKVVIKEMAIFFSSRVLSFGVEEGGLWLFVEALGFGDMSVSIMGFEISGQLIAKIILAVIVVLMNYLLGKFVVFRKNKE